MAEVLLLEPRLSAAGKQLRPRSFAGHQTEGLEVALCSGSGGENEKSGSVPDRPAPRYT